MTLNLNIETKGDPQQPAVLCIHGLLGQGRNLWRLIDGLSKQGFFVISYDQRGHGKSEWAKEYSLSSLGQDALNVLDSLGIDQAHFVGHSMGGRTALSACGIAPHRVRSLSLLDVGPKITAGAVSEIQTIVNPLPLEGFPNKASALEFLGQFSSSINKFLFSNLKKSGPEPLSPQDPSPHYQWIFDLQGLRIFLNQGLKVDQSETFKNLTCPVQLLYGEVSNYITAAEVAQMRELNPSLLTTLIPGAGHWLHVDNLDKTLQQIVKFLIKEA